MKTATELPGSSPDNLSLAETAYRRVRDKLITLQIRPGDPINEQHLAKELQLGRTPLREALKRLERDHLVVSYPRRGTFATMVDITELAQISDIRQALEPLAARRAAESATAGQRGELRQLADSISALNADDDAETLLRYDMAVHRAVYDAAGNEHLADVLIRYDNLATRIWFLVLDKVPHVAQHITEHIGLLHAISDGEAELAAEKARAHVVEFERAIRSVL